MTSTSPPADGRYAEGGQPHPRPASTGTFLTAVADEVGAATVTPAALTRAAVRVLPVDAAGLSTLVNVLRLPLGASSDPARLAEELQTTLGEGPCLAAAEAQQSIVADLEQLKRRWERYGEELVARTPFRAVASVPLSAPGYGVVAALDLYSTNPRLSDRLDHSQVDQVGVTAAALLTNPMEQIHDIDAPDAGPDWYRTAAQRRHDVWIAIGMVMASRPGRTSDALNLLRAHASTTHRSLDDLATDLISGRLPLTDLTG